MAGQFINVTPRVGEQISRNVRQSAKELGLNVDVAN